MLIQNETSDAPEFTSAEQKEITEDITRYQREMAELEWFEMMDA